MVDRQPDEESFEIACIAIGQGDCTLIRCPDGQVVVIDCGLTGKSRDELFNDQKQPLEKASTQGFQTAGYHAARDLLRDSDWNKHENIQLIVTHPDEDHYTLVTRLLAGSSSRKRQKTGAGSVAPVPPPPVDVDTFYFSCPGDAGEELSNFGKHEGALARLTPDRWHKPLPDPVTGKTTEMVSFGTTPEEKKWSVELLLADFNSSGHQGGPEAKKNERSIVTLVTVGEKKALFCGDAETSTLRELLKYHAARIEGIDLLLCPHHGSKNNYLEEFSDTVQAKTVVFSAAFLGFSHHHPHYEPIKGYKETAVDSTQLHSIDFWIHDLELLRAEKDIRDNIREAFKTGKRWSGFGGPGPWPHKPGHIQVELKKKPGGEFVETSGRYLIKPLPTDFVVAIDKDKRGRLWYLYREETAKRVYTLSSGSLLFTLSADGLRLLKTQDKTQDNRLEWTDGNDGNDA